MDISSLRKESKFITYDDGYGNTGSCESSITFIDGDKGILRYRGYDIAELAEKSNFLETCFLLFNEELPTLLQFNDFLERISGNLILPPSVERVIEGISDQAHPMGILGAGLHALGGSYPQFSTNSRPADIDSFEDASSIILILEWFLLNFFLLLLGEPAQLSPF